jgi:hypothetical protein
VSLSAHGDRGLKHGQRTVKLRRTLLTAQEEEQVPQVLDHIIHCTRCGVHKSSRLLNRMKGGSTGTGSLPIKTPTVMVAKCAQCWNLADDELPKSGGEQSNTLYGPGGITLDGADDPRGVDPPPSCEVFSGPFRFFPK